MSDTEDQLWQQELNETKSLLVKYQVDLQSRLDCKVKNTKKGCKFLNKTKEYKSISLGCKKNYKTCNHYS